MTKSKNITQRAERILAQPTVHTFNFKKVPLEKVAQVLNHLRGFFKSTRSEDSDSQDAQLYFEYSASINEYLAKRLKTYTDKYRRLHPLPPIYTQQDMIAAVNKFFGVDHFFGDEIIKHTESGGCYIDELSLIRKLTFQQAQKLSNYVDPTRLDDDRHNSSFAVTDAIMQQFNPVHK